MKIHGKILEKNRHFSPYSHDQGQKRQFFLSFPIKPEKLKALKFDYLEKLETKKENDEIHAKFTTRRSLKKN